MWHLYLDESGDLGFDFENKHPSEYLTISVLATSHHETIRGIDRAVKKTLARKINRKKILAHELKGTLTNLATKQYFYNQVRHFEFGIYALTLSKRRVRAHLRSSPNAKSRLYNYIASQVMQAIPFERASYPVEIVLDKSKGKREIQDFNQYIRQQLEGRLDPRCTIRIHHRDSATDGMLSATDLFCWGIYRTYEQGDDSWYDTYRDKVVFNEKYLA